MGTRTASAIGGRYASGGTNGGITKSATGPDQAAPSGLGSGDTGITGGDDIVAVSTHKDTTRHARRFW